MPVGFVAAAVGTIGAGVYAADAAKDAAQTQAGAASQASQVQREMFDISNAQQQPYMQSGYAANDTLSRLLGLAPSSGNSGTTTGTSNGSGVNLNAAGMPDWQQYLLDNPDVAADPYFSQNPELHYSRHGKGEGRQLPTIAASTTGAGGGAIDPATGYAADNTGLATGYLSQTFGPEQFAAGVDPGYQWRLQQGAQGVQNTAAAGSGSLSGPALKALMEYNQGAASQEYGAAFDRFQTQQGNIFQRLSSIAGLGQNAAAGVGNQAVATGSSIGANITGAGNAAAAGQVGAANAYSGAASDLGSLAYLYSLQP